MVRLLVAVAIVAIAAGVAEVVRRRRVADAPTQPLRQVPSQLDRGDFAAPQSPWLVAVFSSDTCSSCADVISKAEVLRSPDVSVSVIPFQTDKALHERYAVDSVPCLVLADADGTVHAGFIGPITAADLWAAVAEARSPGSIDRSTCSHHEV
jgi:thioredoxin-related protein